MDTTHFSGFFLSNSRYFTTSQSWGLSLSCFFFEKSRSNVCEKYWLTQDCNGGFLNPLHSPRNEHSKTEFGKKNLGEKFGELETFSGSKFDPATGISKTYSMLFSAKFGPFSNPLREHGMHDERAEWNCSWHGLCSKTWEPPRLKVETLWVSNKKSTVLFRKL